MNYRDWREALIEFWKAKYSDLLKDYNELAIRYNNKSEIIKSCLGDYKTLDPRNFEGKIISINKTEESMEIEFNDNVKISLSFKGRGSSFFDNFKEGTKVAIKMVYEHE